MMRKVNDDNMKGLYPGCGGDNKDITDNNDDEDTVVGDSCVVFAAAADDDDGNDDDGDSNKNDHEEQSQQVQVQVQVIVLWQKNDNNVPPNTTRDNNDNNLTLNLANTHDIYMLHARTQPEKIKIRKDSQQ